MYYAYILKNLKDLSYYYGSSSDVENRLRQHNAGKSKYTKGHRPYKINYLNLYQSRKKHWLETDFLKAGLIKGIRKTFINNQLSSFNKLQHF